MPAFVSPPQGRDCCCAILACDNHRGIAILCLESIHIDGHRLVSGLNAAMAAAAAAAALSLHNIKLGALRHAIIVCRTTVAAFGTSRAVAAAAAGTGARLRCIGSNIGCAGGFGQQLGRRSRI